MYNYKRNIKKHKKLSSWSDEGILKQHLKRKMLAMRKID